MYPRIFAFFKFTSRTLASIFHVALVWNRECPFSLSLPVSLRLSPPLAPSRWSNACTRSFSSSLSRLHRALLPPVSWKFRTIRRTYDVRTPVWMRACTASRTYRGIRGITARFSLNARLETHQGTRWSFSPASSFAANTQEKRQMFGDSITSYNNIAICWVDNLSASWNKIPKSDNNVRDIAIQATSRFLHAMYFSMELYTSRRINKKTASCLSSCQTVIIKYSARGTLTLAYFH